MSFLSATFANEATTNRPTVFVSMEASNVELEAEATQTSELLVAALSQFRTLTIAKASYATSRSSDRGHRYEIDLKYYGEAGSRSVWWQVVDADGDVLRSGVERIEGGDIKGRAPVAVQNAIVASLAKEFASTRGVINRTEVLESPDDTIGNACILRMEFALDSGNMADARGYRPCLERTLSAAPADSDAMALMARLAVAGDDRLLGGKAAVVALDFARKAVALAPLSDRAQAALMAAQLANGQPSAALEAGKRALALNPNNTEVAAKLAMTLYMAGDRDKAVEIARDSGQSTDGALPRDTMIVLALDAYNGGQYSQASLLAEQVSHGDFLVCALKTASLAQINSKMAYDRLKELRVQHPDFDRQLHSKLSAKGLPTSIVAGLEAGLIKAGANIAAPTVANVSSN